MDFMVLGELIGEESSGALAAEIIAARHINQNPDPALFGACIPNVTLHLRDHQGSVNIAAEFVIAEAQDSTYDLNGILGPDYSSISTVVSPVASVYGVPVLSHWATSPKLNDPVYSNFFRTIPDDEAAALGVLEYLHNNRIHHMNVGYSSDAYGIGFTEALLRDAKDYGVAIRSVALTEDLAEIGREIEASPVNVWMIIPSNSAGLLNPMLQEITRPVHFLFSEAVSNSQLPSYSDANLRKMTGSVVIKAQGLKNGHEKADALLKTLRETGLTQAEWEALPAEFSAAYASVGGIFPIPSDVVAFSYDAVFAMALAVCNGKEHKALEGLPAVSFEGASGLVRFDKESGTRDPSTSYMTASQLQSVENGQSLFVQEYEYSSGWVTPFKPIVMEGGVEFQNIVPIATEEIRVGSITQTIVVVIAVLNVLCAAACGLWSVRNRASKIVSRAQPEFLYLMCAGCIISSSVPIVLTVESHEACQGAWLAYSFGFSITVGSLSAKTLRLYRLFDAASHSKRLTLSVKDSLTPILVIMFVNVGIAIGMKESSNVDFVITDLAADEYGRVLSREYHCKSAGLWTSLFFMWNVMILSFLAILCYKSRKISTDFSESKYISMSVASSLQIILLGFLLIVISDNSPTLDYLMVSLMTLVTDGSTLFLIFVPKLHVFMNGNNEIALPSHIKSSASRYSASRNSARTETPETTPETTPEPSPTNMMRKIPSLVASSSCKGSSVVLPV